MYNASLVFFIYVMVFIIAALIICLFQEVHYVLIQWYIFNIVWRYTYSIRLFLIEAKHRYRVGLCDMDKNYISRFFYFFFDFDFNHDFDTNRHALSYTSCFCTSYLFLHILSCTSCFALFLILLHILLFISFFYLYICSCVVLLLYNFYSLHCPLSGPDLIYISLLIIPCIIYYVTNKETLTFTVINAFCVNLKHISKENQLDLSQNVVTDKWQNTHIYIYIYIICICE